MIKPIWYSNSYCKRSLMNGSENETQRLAKAIKDEICELKEKEEMSDQRIQELESELETKQSELAQTKDLLKQAQSQNLKLLQIIEMDDNPVQEYTEPRSVRCDSLISKLRKSRRVLQEMQTRCDRVIGGRYASHITSVSGTSKPRPSVRSALDRELFGSGRIGMEFGTRLDKNFMPKHCAYFAQSDSSSDDTE